MERYIKTKLGFTYNSTGDYVRLILGEENIYVQYDEYINNKEKYKNYIEYDSYNCDHSKSTKTNNQISKNHKSLKEYSDWVKIKKEYPNVKFKYNPTIKDWNKNPKKTLYYCKVWLNTELNDLSLLENHDKRGYTNYHLDHIFPISKGFEQGIAPEVIGGINNLQFLPWEENMLKSNKIR